jgi:type I restriction enzyme, S subunit
MRWQQILLGEVLDIKHGYAFKGEHFSDSGDFVLLSPGNCHENGGLKLKGDKEKYYLGDFPSEYLLSEGDMLVVMTDLINQAPILGGSFLIPESNRFLHNQRLGLVQITDSTRIEKTYLYYLLNTYGYRAQVRGSASGATVRHTSPGRIRNCTVNVPRDITYQGKIAKTLWVYDELSENNRRRIALLEDAAKQLYREWFVRLRFPGYEHTAVINGVPDGWRRTDLGQMLTLKRGHDLPSANRIDGEIPIVSSSGITGFHNEKKATAPGVVTGRYGTIGEVYFVQQDYWPLNTALYVCDFKGNPPAYVAHLLKDVLAGTQSNKAAIPGVNRNVLHRIPILAPTKRLIDQFGEFAKSTFEQIGVLETMNQKLSSARDLLLPRLMSGEIAV